MEKNDEVLNREKQLEQMKVALDMLDGNKTKRSEIKRGLSIREVEAEQEELLVI